MRFSKEPRLTASTAEMLMSSFQLKMGINQMGTNQQKDDLAPVEVFPTTWKGPQHLRSNNLSVSIVFWIKKA